MAGVPVVVMYDGSPVAGVLFGKTWLTGQINAVPSEGEVWVRDLDRSHTFVTGHEVVLLVDGTPRWGGYISSVSLVHFFPDKIAPAQVLHLIDYNVIFDRRVIRWTPSTTLPTDFYDQKTGDPHDPNPDADSYLKSIPVIPGDTTSGQALKWLVELFADMDDFDTSGIEDVASVSADGDHATPWAYMQQGLPIRQQFESLALQKGALFYCDAAKVIHFRAFETGLNDWGFSDDPNHTTTFGFREAEMVEDGSVIVNDALIWGGSEFAGSGGTVFARVQDATSQSDHGRWQTAETHFGEEGFGIQDGVDARANAIVLGPPGADALNQQKGLRYPQYQFAIKWFHHRVPTALEPGTIVPVDMTSFSLEKQLPLRSVRIDFPTLDNDGNAYVRYAGDFSLLSTDPFSLWALLMRGQFKKNKMLLGAANDDSTATVFGAYGSFSPTHVSGDVYKIPFGYVNGTLLVYDDGLLLTPGVDFTESAPLTGRFELASAPTGNLYATCRTLSS